MMSWSKNSTYPFPGYLYYLHLHWYIQGVGYLKQHKQTSVDLIFLSFEIMGFIVELWNY